MGTDRRNPNLPQQSDQISADKYQPIEPAHADPNLPTPIGLTWEERGGSGEPITVATEPISVLAWVRCLKISTHVNGPALPFNVDALRCLR